MPNLRQIKRHINSVRSIAKVTNTLEVISAAKSLRLQSRVTHSRLFAVKSWDVLTHLASAAEPELQSNPMFCGYDKVDRVAMILITSQRGLAGAYNANVLRQALDFIERSPAPVVAITLGRQGRQAMLRRGVPIHADLALPEEKVEVADLTPLAQIVLDGFTQRSFDEVVLVYTRYQLGARLQPATRTLLPFSPDSSVERHEYVYEPEPQELLRSLLPRVIRFQIFEAYVESLMAENASRVAAMRTATQNAQDLIEDLTMSYNKGRQQAITTELSDLAGARLHAAKDEPNAPWGGF